MNINNKILFFIFFLIFSSGLNGYAQNLPMACGGSIERYRVVGSVNSVFDWDVGTAGKIVNIYSDGDSVDIRWNTVEGGTKNITVTETNIYGCMGEPYTQTLMLSVPNVNIGLDAEICIGDEYKFVPIGSDVNAYLWSDNSNGDELVVSIAGDYWVRVTDSVGCEVADTASLIVHSLPVVDLGNDTVLCSAADILELDAFNTDYNSYEWWINEVSESYSSSLTITTQSISQEVRVSVEDINGCIGGDTITVAFCGDFFIPNAFTPNEDGDNETWEIEYIEAFPEVTVDIYNRFGDRIFSSTGYDEPWDGTDEKGKKLPMDTYYYVIDFHNGEAPQVGSVTLIR